MLQGVHHTFVSWVEAIEEDADRLGVTFATRRGYFWVPRQAEELVGALRRSIQTGALLEVLFHAATLEIVDLIRR